MTANRHNNDNKYMKQTKLKQQTQNTEEKKTQNKMTLPERTWCKAVRATR